MISMHRDWRMAIKYFETMESLCEHPKETKAMM